MVMPLDKDPSRGSTPEVIVDLIEKHQDDAARRLLLTASLAVRAEAIREYLWRGDAGGVSIAKKLLDLTCFPSDEVRAIFATAAEVGEISTMRLILKDARDAIDSKTVRLAFQAALHEMRTEVITFLCETKRLTRETKYRAIQPSIYKASLGPDHLGTARCEMGTAETIITAEWRNEVADRRERRNKELRAKPEVPSDKRRWRVERRCQGLIAESTSRIRQSLPLLGPEHPLHEVENRRETQGLLIAQCRRELTRQMEVSLIQEKVRSHTGSSDRARKIGAWRTTNPEGHRESRSFAEVVEDVFNDNRVVPSDKRRDFSGLIDAVLAEWRSGRAPLSREGLSQVIEAHHPKGKTLSNTVMYAWKNHPEHGPNQASMEVLVEAFKLAKVHELMMWRIAKGAPSDDLEGLIDDAESSFRTPEERDARARLFTTLVESSGIPLVRLQQLLGVWQLSLWKRGQSIADPEVCATLVQLVNPPATYRPHEREAVDVVNKRLEAVLGARCSTIFDAVFAAERVGTVNPSGTLLELLTGKRSLRQLTHAQGAALLGVTESVFRHMRSSSDSRGAAITEDQANTILDWVQRVTPETRKLLSVVERAERRLAVDQLTGIPSPVALLVRLRQGELRHAGEIVRLTRERRGVYQFPGMSDFELGKAHVMLATAQELADWLGFVGADNVEARRSFICFATGVDQSQTPDQIFDQVVSGELHRHLALRALFDLTGKSRKQVSQSMGHSKSSAQSLSTEWLDGKISSRRRAIAVAREVGLLHRCDEFFEVFRAHQWVGTAEKDAFEAQ